MERRVAGLARRVALGTASVALMLATSEALVRLALPAFDPTSQLQLVQHGELLLGPPNTVTRQAKNTGDYDVEVRFGPRGFRDARDVARAGTEDVLVLGDSFAFGWGVEQRQRFSDRLETLSGLRVWNLGMPGQDVQGYGRLLRHAEQLGSRARKLVIALSVETDLAEPGSNARPTAEAEANWLASAKAWLAAHSALYGVMTTLVHGSSWLERLAVKAGLIVPNLESAGVGSASMHTLSSVAERVAALARGYEAVVLMVPSRGLWLDHHGDAERLLHDRLLSELTGHGLQVVDPRAAFEAGGEPLRYHFARDGHWNAHGHAVAAQLLALTLTTAR